jgi:hypothetical protein
LAYVIILVEHYVYPFIAELTNLEAKLTPLTDLSDEDEADGKPQQRFEEAVKALCTIKHDKLFQAKVSTWKAYVAQELTISLRTADKVVECHGILKV